MVVRHHLDGSAASVEAATRDLVVVHSSDPLTPFLAYAARVRDATRETVERALYEHRTLWRLHAMRRTIFVVDAADAELLYLACGRKVAMTERRRIVGYVAEALREVGAPGAEDAAAWFDDVAARTIAAVEAAGSTTTTSLRNAVDGLDLTLLLGSGRYTQTSPLASRLLYQVAMEGLLVRGRPAGSWRASQYTWSTPSSWFGDGLPALRCYGPAAADPSPAEVAQAKADLAERYLRTHGPATPEDLTWFMGWTKTDTTAALAALDLVEVDLGVDGDGVVLADDLAPEAAADEPVVTLVPSLDPAVMGWKRRGFYLAELDELKGPMFDYAGNAGPAILVDGWVVGGWSQRPDGEVVWRLLRDAAGGRHTDVGADVAERVATEAARLQDWIGPDPVTTRFRAPLDKELASS